MGHAALASYLRPGHPREYANDGSSGNTYVYRAATATITSNIPQVGEAWADSRPVVSREAFEFSAGSGISELIVVTGANTAYAGALGTPTAEEDFFELDWRPVSKPLEVHPEFGAGGTFELDETGRKCIIGWRAEQDPALKAARKFRALDSNGVPGDEVDIATASPNALAFIKLCEIGVEEYIDYMPIWRKRSMYRGSVGPGTSAIGQYTATPSGSGYPAGYEWVKSKDSAQRVGRSSKWKRDEEWEGAKIVFVDIDEVFPPT